ncbi:MAG TPA: hypothetical protein VMF66_17725 [Candidatus Acidoferrum sp.]|nr:hypothetical protein [Candidatus Acidoferrum sp.]
MNTSRKTFHDITLLTLLTCGAILVHGYHPFAEDAGIYVPQIRKLLHPGLYPFDAQFFESHAHMTLFPNFVASLVRITHLRLSVVLFLCQFFSIFLLLLVCRRIAVKCFPAETSRWAAVALIAALLTIPATGTALYLMDQYFNPRSISTFSILFAIDAALERKFLRSTLWLVFTALIHPLMVVFGAFYIAVLATTDKVLAKKTSPSLASAAVTAVAVPSLLHPSSAFFQTLNDHHYYFVLRWHWYEWMGIFAPLVLLWWFSRIGERKHRPALKIIGLSLIAFGVACVVGALIVSIPGLQVLAIGQPMRGFQLLYLLMFLIAGGLIGETFLKKRVLLWIAFFAPICAGMAFAQFQVFPSDRHIEWPGAASTNPWVQAFTWIHANTPSDAIFALNPSYMALPGEDNQGFRAIAARSSLADAVKDWSASAMFPASPLATECLEQVRAVQGWQNFQAADFERLKQIYGVNWVVLDHRPAANLLCPYQEGKLSVCEIH